MMITKTNKGFEGSIKSLQATRDGRFRRRRGYGGQASSAFASVKPRGATPLYGVHAASRRWLPSSLLPSYAEAGSFLR
jgi:hypothetical protein